MSFDGFVQIYKKRNLLSPSQKEIANIVEQMLDEIKSIPNNPFEYSLKAFNL
jgi:galactose-1-phosphate uridylyltransferase